ncbi:MAG TPA: O-antigen ligase family protein [Flavobacteriaceae bacterium]|nr:O-antigen ligase family protein [Flavobacteriaceae bacterium]
MLANNNTLSYSSFNFDWFIVATMFMLLPVDMINGILLKEGIEFPISIGQFYKLFVIFLIFIRLCVRPKLDFLLLLGTLILFTIPSIFQFFSNDDYSLRIIFDDFIKTSKYISVFLVLIYFQRIFTFPRKKTRSLVKSWLVFSYLVFAINILLKYLGLGFPMYDYDNTGTTGFFYAGNEISALFLVLYGIIAYHLYEIKKAKTWFFMFFLFNLFLGITITSKTAMLGIILVTLLILANPENLKRISLRKIMIWITSIVLLIPLTVYIAYELLKDSLIMHRIDYFYNKWDLTTFIFSERNLRVKEMIPIYKKDWTIWEKIIGGGQYFYENQLGNIIEIDFLDIFFAYGIIGALIFTVVIIGLFLKGFLQIKNRFPYARLALLMLFVLVLESSIAGHVFNSGIAGIYIGACFGLMFFKPAPE